MSKWRIKPSFKSCSIKVSFFGVGRWPSEQLSLTPSLIPSTSPSFVPSGLPSEAASEQLSASLLPSIEPSQRPTINCDNRISWWTIDGESKNCWMKNSVLILWLESMPWLPQNICSESLSHVQALLHHWYLAKCLVSLSSSSSSSLSLPSLLLLSLPSLPTLSPLSS